jgi:aspartate/methionine/tyrosine aminotransferase
MALLEMKNWLNDPEKLVHLKQLYPVDAIERARKISENCPSVGAYSASNGLGFVRESVAKFISKRDGGCPTDIDNIYLTNGASEGIARVLNMIISGGNVGVMIPVPQYPLYTATLAMLDGVPVEYYLNESDGWSLSLGELERSIEEAKSRGIDTRALVFINPANPTGSILTEENLKDLIRFCQREGLVILADEVYQENIYDPVGKPFRSVKRVLYEMGREYFEGVELISFHSTSKGLIGECGRRGGYFECHGLDPLVMEQVFKVASISLCSNILGQIMVSLMVDPPQEGDESYELYSEERRSILGFF